MSEVKVYLVPVVKDTRVLRVMVNGRRTGAWVNAALAARIVAAQERLLLSKSMPLWNVEIDGFPANFDNAVQVKEALQEFPQLADASCVESLAAVGVCADWPKVFLINNGSFGYVLIKSGAFRMLNQHELNTLKNRWPELKRAAVDQTFGRQTFVAHSCSRIDNVLDFLPALAQEATALAETEMQFVQSPHVNPTDIGVGTVVREVAAPRPAFQEKVLTDEDVAALERDAGNFQKLSGIRAKDSPVYK